MTETAVQGPLARLLTRVALMVITQQSNIAARDGCISRRIKLLPSPANGTDYVEIS